MIGLTGIEGLEAEMRDRLAAKNAEIDFLRKALEEIVDPLGVMRARAEADGNKLSGMAYGICYSVPHLQSIAKEALAGTYKPVRKSG